MDPLSLWLIGYVDYTDRFNARHRHRFTRKYRPQEPGLSEDERWKRSYYVVDTRPGFNGEYDTDDQGQHRQRGSAATRH